MAAAVGDQGEGIGAVLGNRVLVAQGRFIPSICRGDASTLPTTGCRVAVCRSLS